MNFLLIITVLSREEKLKEADADLGLPHVRRLFLNHPLAKTGQAPVNFDVNG